MWGWCWVDLESSPHRSMQLAGNRTRGLDGGLFLFGSFLHLPFVLGCSSWGMVYIQFIWTFMIPGAFWAEIWASPETKNLRTLQTVVRLGLLDPWWSIQKLLRKTSQPTNDIAIDLCMYGSFYVCRQLHANNFWWGARATLLKIHASRGWLGKTSLDPTGCSHRNTAWTARLTNIKMANLQEHPVMISNINLYMHMSIFQTDMEMKLNGWAWISYNWPLLQTPWSYLQSNWWNSAMMNLYWFVSKTRRQEPSNAELLHNFEGQEQLPASGRQMG